MGVLIALVVACVVSELFWWLVGLAAVVLVVRLMFRWAAASADRAMAEAERLRAVGARADEQHQWCIEGDDRGVFGLFPPASVV